MVGEPASEGGGGRMRDVGGPIKSNERRSGRAARERMERRARKEGGDRVLGDKLRMTIAPKQQAEIVKPGDNPLQFHPVDQEDRQWCFGFANVIKEGVL